MVVIPHPSGDWLVRAGGVVFGVPAAVGEPLQVWHGQRPTADQLAKVAPPPGIDPAQWLTFMDSLVQALAGTGTAGRRLPPSVWLRLPLLPPGVVQRLAGWLAPLASRGGLGALVLVGLAGYGHLAVATAANPIRPAPGPVGWAVGLFAAAILAASTGLVYLPVALGCVVAAYLFLNIVPIRDVYHSVEWPVIVLLGSMIPIGAALQSTGSTTLIAESIVNLASGHSPVLVLTLLIVVTMTLSDVMNNTATAVIAAPIAIEISALLNVNPDPFLMGVAVAASCAFLTPIGHKNNTLILGPGGYRFGDYWRMGLPLEIIIIAVSVPAITTFWPL